MGNLNALKESVWNCVDPLCCLFVWLVVGRLTESDSENELSDSLIAAVAMHWRNLFVIHCIRALCCLLFFWLVHCIELLATTSNNDKQTCKGAKYIIGQVFVKATYILVKY